MNKETLNIIGRRGFTASQPSGQMVSMYDRSVVGVCDIEGVEGASVRPYYKKDITSLMHITESVGGELSSVAGCYANNANASASTLNSNNAMSNSNANYAGAFADNNKKNGKHSTTQATSLKTTDEGAVTDAHPSDEYDLPFFERGETIRIAESTAYNGIIDSSIIDELMLASKKRHIKSFKRFFVHPKIVAMGVDRCLKCAATSRATRWLENHRDEVINRIINELTNETYSCRKPYVRKLNTIHKEDKERYTETYNIYDRCVQNIALIVLTPKLTRCVPRTCYSGIKNRSLLSNDKRFCLINRIRTAVIKHPEAWVGVTDIKHFYDTLDSKIALGVLFEKIKCRFTRWLLANILLTHDTLTIGGTLSQLIAMLVLADVDEELTRKYKPQFYASFGDNRIIIDDDKKKVGDAVHFLISYMEGRYNLTIKNDWQVMRVKHGFRFCKYDFFKSFVHVRHTIRKRAIKAYRQGKQHYAGYLGMLMKTDSKRLRAMIESRTIKNNIGMKVKRMVGTKVKINALAGKTILITDWKRVDNNKESEYYIRFQCITKDENEKYELNICNCGAYEIKEFFKLVERGEANTEDPIEVKCDGTSYYFNGYHTSNEEALDILRKAYNF